jgi:hypothetical protein
MRKRPASSAGRFLRDPGVGALPPSRAATPPGYLENGKDHQAGMTAPWYFSSMNCFTAGS